MEDDQLRDVADAYLNARFSNIDMESLPSVTALNIIGSRLEVLDAVGLRLRDYNDGCTDALGKCINLRSYLFIRGLCSMCWSRVQLFFRHQ